MLQLFAKDKVLALYSFYSCHDFVSHHQLNEKMAISYYKKLAGIDVHVHLSNERPNEFEATNERTARETACRV